MTKQTEQGAAPCGECGMLCRPAEFHPYAACMMFKACGSATIVRANLAWANPPAQTEREAALCDAAYVAGAQAGFNAAASPDPMALHKLLETRAGYLAVLKRTAANPTPEGWRE